MFKPEVYRERRRRLRDAIPSGLLIFPGNNDSPMNYPDNPYHFVQDASFLYYWGLDAPGLAAIVDVDSGEEVLFGDDPGIDAIVWMGAQPSMAERAAAVGVQTTRPFADFRTVVEETLKRNREVHFLPQYRCDNLLLLSDILQLPPDELNEKASEALIRAVVAQRSVKSPEELVEIEAALDITREMHLYALEHARPGVVEQEIAGAMEGIAVARGGRLAFPVIFSVDGQTLHNHSHHNIMQAGQLAVNDSGACSGTGYAGDITRTIPVSGKFSAKQREIYEIVLRAESTSIEQVKPGVPFRDVHLHAANVVASGLKELGLMKGDVAEAVAAGAHALFFPHGLGHMMGLDVHDMENLGEDYVGYDDEVRRSDQFGLAYLRLGKRLQPGYVITVEPGIYFIPQLIDLWQAEHKHADFINYEQVNRYRDFGGIRIEEDVVVTDTGYRILGKPIPKEVTEVERGA